jgi:hypothetical protein
VVPLRALLASLPLVGCNAAIVASSVGLLGTGAALNLDCPGYVTVTLHDGQTGAAICGQRVIARSGDRERQGRSCATMALPEGRWQLQAEGGGDPSMVEVERAQNCERWHYAVELDVGPRAHFAFGSSGLASSTSSAPSPSKSARDGDVTSITALPASADEKNFASWRECSRTGISMENDAGSRGKRSSPACGTPGKNSRRSKRL